EGPVRSDDAMTGNDDGDPVLAVGAADGAARSRAAEIRGKFAIGAGFPEGHLTKSGPHGLLEFGSGQAQRNLETAKPSFEIALQFFLDPVQMGIPPRGHRIPVAAPQFLEL